MSNVSGDFYTGETIEQCPPACNTMDFTFGYPSAYKARGNETAFVTFYFGKSVTVRESHLAYPGSSLFAEIGGYTGLLLGFSLFDFARFFEFISKRVQRVGKMATKANQ